MIPWREIGRAAVAGEATPLVLLQHGPEFAIRIGPRALMTSAAHGSEEVLAERSLGPVAARGAARILIGGIGMGYTLAAALGRLAPDASVIVSELVPAIVEWNRGLLAHLAGRPLDDPRVSVRECDVATVIRESSGMFDAILLDVDNGPGGLTRAANDRLYAPAGLKAAHRALRARGVLGVWSVAPDSAFQRRLVDAGFAVEEVTARARGTKGGRHTLWLATRR